MFLNLFAKVFGFIAGIREGILAAYATVADAVVGLMLVPFASLFGALTNAGVNGVCELMELTGRGTIGLFCVDAGTNGSLFDIMVGSIAWINPTMRIGGLCLVFFIFLCGMVKLMITSGKPSESPGVLICTTFVSGVLVSSAPLVFSQFQKIFNAFLSAIMGYNTTGDLNFSGFATSAQTFVQGGSLEISLGAQVASVVTCVVYFILIVSVAINFFKFFFEVAQRYVVLIILFITAPVAVAFLASANTRRSFNAWVRMVGTTMFLICTNAFFMGVFFRSMSSFDTALTTLQKTGATATAAPMIIVVLWCIAMSAILIVAGKLDTYLQSIGLSTAETGSAAMATMVAELFAMGAMETIVLGRRLSRKKSGEDERRKASAPKYAEKPAGVIQNVKATIMGKRNYTKQKVKAMAKFDRSGSITSQSLNEIVSKAAPKVRVGGAAYGRGVIKAMNGIPSKLTDRLDPTTCTVSNGSIHMLTRSNGTGHRGSITMLRKDMMKAAGGIIPGGRVVSLDGVEYIAYASGHDALTFNAYNPGAKAAIQKSVGEAGRVSQVYSNGSATGVFRMDTKTAEGMRIVREWAPSSCYQADASLGAALEKMEGLTYYTYEVSYAPVAKGSKEFTGQCANPIIPPDPKDRESWLKTQFPTMAGNGFTVSGGSDGIINLEHAGKRFVMAPIAEYSINLSGNNATPLKMELQTAGNGTKYIQVDVTKEVEAHIKRMFIKRGDPNDPLSSEIDFSAYSLTEEARGSVSEILKAAKERLKKGDS